MIDAEAVVLRRTKPIDNSAVVRELDPRASREIWLLLLLVATLAGAMPAYAWPHFELRQVALERQQLEREKERLLGRTASCAWSRPRSRTCGASNRPVG